jgi:hypothetical protein
MNINNTETVPPIWEELAELRDSLYRLGNIEDVKTFIKNNMQKDVKVLQDKFKNEFDDIPTTDPFRLEILQTLAELGIIIYNAQPILEVIEE